MADSYKNALKNIQYVNPPKGLYGRILERIEFEKRRSAAIHLLVLVPLCVLSFVAMVPAAQFAMSELHQSNFYQYFSLIFSDGLAILSYWQTYALSLAESIPLLGITILLATVFVLLGSFRLALHDLKSAVFPKLIH